MGPVPLPAADARAHPAAAAPPPRRTAPRPQPGYAAPDSVKSCDYVYIHGSVVCPPELALPLARSGNYDLVVFGHTHEVEERIEKGLMLNPGEVGGWLTGRCTVALVDLESLEVEIRDLS